MVPSNLPVANPVNVCLFCPWSWPCSFIHCISKWMMPCSTLVFMPETVRDMALSWVPVAFLGCHSLLMEFAVIRRQWCDLNAEQNSEAVKAVANYSQNVLAYISTERKLVSTHFWHYQDFIISSLLDRRGERFSNPSGTWLLPTCVLSLCTFWIHISSFAHFSIMLLSLCWLLKFFKLIQSVKSFANQRNIPTLYIMLSVAI